MNVCRFEVLSLKNLSPIVFKALYTIVKAFGDIRSKMEELWEIPKKMLIKVSLFPKLNSNKLSSDIL